MNNNINLRDLSSPTPILDRWRRAVYARGLEDAARLVELSHAPDLATQERLRQISAQIRDLRRGACAATTTTR